MKIDYLKSQILSLFETFSDLDIDRTPHIYFLRSLKTELENKCLRRELIEIALKMNVNLTGLGVDYEPHKEFLDSAAKHISNLVEKMSFMVEEFGIGAFEDFFCKMSLTID